MAGHPGESYEIRRAYPGPTGLQAWENARDGDLVTESRTEVGVAYDDGSAFTGVVAIDTLSSSATNYMHLAVAKGHGHNGLAGTGVLLDGLGGTNGINVLEDVTRVEGFELEDHTVERAILLTAGVTDVVFDRLLIHDAAFALKADSGSVFTLRNSIIYDSTEAVHDDGTTATIENCTIYNMSLADGALKEDIGTYTVINTISMDNVGQDFKDITTQINNLSSDASAVGFPSKSSAVQFVSTAARNFHLIAAADAIDNASALSFCCDVDGQPRGSSGWDIGADELNGNAIYRSIGTAADDVAGTITATNGWNVVYGSGTAWETNNRGRGDRIDINGTDYTILSVDSDTKLTLTTPVVGSFSGAYTVSRQFTTLANWETCIDGGPCAFFPVASPSLVADNRSEVGIAYEETVLARVTISGSTTDATHTITLTADGVNRHYGIPGNGTVVSGGSLAVILVKDEFVTLEWLEVTGGTQEGLEVEALSAPNKLVLRNMLVHDIPLQGILLDDPDATADVYNNIVYSTGTGLKTIALTTGTMRIFNNTFYNNTNDGILASGSNPSITLINNISHSNGGTDFNVSGRNASSRHNLASDTSGTTHSPAGGGQNSVALGAVNFVDSAGGDLHIQSASAAEDCGGPVFQPCELSSIFNIDIDGGARQTPWDIGADDIAVTTEVELVSFTATGVDGAVELTWETATELDNVGFHLYRATSPGGPLQRVTAQVIPGLGSSPAGASYRFVDDGLTNGVTYYYELEDIETTGRTERHGPVSANPLAGVTATETSSTRISPTASRRRTSFVS